MGNISVQISGQAVVKHHATTAGTQLKTVIGIFRAPLLLITWVCYPSAAHYWIHPGLKFLIKSLLRYRMKSDMHFILLHISDYSVRVEIIGVLVVYVLQLSYIFPVSWCTRFTGTLCIFLDVLYVHAIVQRFPVHFSQRTVCKQYHPPFMWKDKESRKDGAKVFGSYKLYQVTKSTKNYVPVVRISSLCCFLIRKARLRTTTHADSRLGLKSRARTNTYTHTDTHMQTNIHIHSLADKLTHRHTCTNWKRN